jgi:hypothetical protein
MVGRAVNRFLVAALIGGGCCPAAARGQTLFGTVVDESSTPVSGVLVTLRDSALQVGTRPAGFSCARTQVATLSVSST